MSMIPLEKHCTFSKAWQTINYIFKFGNCAQRLVKVYKYYGLWFDEFATLHEAVRVLSPFQAEELLALKYIVKLKIIGILDIKDIIKCVIVEYIQH